MRTCARRKNTLTFAVLRPGRRLVWISSASMLESASSAASICTAVAFYAIGAVVWPLNVSVNVPAVAPVHAHGLLLVGLLELNGP